MNYITEAFKMLEDDKLDVEVIDKNNSPVKVEPTTTAIVDNDLNARIIAKIEELSNALATALEDEGLEVGIDPELIKQDMIRDCGLMGDVISTDTLNLNNPMDASTKFMHDNMRVDPQMACDTLLHLTPEQFVSGFMRGLRASRGRLPGPQFGGQLPNRRRELPHNIEPRLIDRRRN